MSFVIIYCYYFLTLHFHSVLLSLVCLLSFHLLSLTYTVSLVPIGLFLDLKIKFYMITSNKFLPVLAKTVY